MSCSHPFPIDVEQAREIVDGDVGLFEELVGMFLESAPGRLEELRTSIQTGDFPEIRNRAHGIKGALKNFAALPAVAKVRVLEDAAEREDRSGAEAACRDLADEIECLGYYYLKQLWKERFYE